ncbi:hypothetical protein KA005_56395 [bacterium]|nr:hypothetical protein [bacterium]
MIFDVKLVFNADKNVGEDLAGTDTTVIFADIVDLGGAGQKFKGKPLYAGIQIVAPPSAGTSVKFTITTCATVGGSYVAAGESAVYPIADLTKGKEIKIPVPEDSLEFFKCSAVNVGAIADLTAMAGLMG